MARASDFLHALAISAACAALPVRKQGILPIAFENLYAAFDPHTAELAIMVDQQTVDYGYGVENLCYNRGAEAYDSGSAVLKGDHLEITIVIEETTETEAEA